jgi:serine/threonine-protein kinase
MLDREVAIKVLRPDLVRQAELIERFRQEAIALARLHHPHIATLFGLERHGDNLLMIMEYVRGETLEQIVLRSGRLAWPRAAELCAAVLEALDHAHDKGVVHRDVKPANVMLTHAGVVKVMDFGIARVMGKSRQTRMGNVVGTPMYMSPEQLKGEEVDGRSDLYAVGAVLFELVTGRMAFEADSDYQLMMKQLNEPPPRLGELVSDAPPELDAIVQRAMAKRRDERFADALVFRDSLRALVAARAPAARPRVAAPETRLAPGAPSPSVDAAPRATAEQTVAPGPEPAETRLAPAPEEPPAPSFRRSGAVPNADGLPSWRGTGGPTPLPRRS